jgi:hypothetical protein
MRSLSLVAEVGKGINRSALSAGILLALSAVAAFGGEAAAPPPPPGFPPGLDWTFNFDATVGAFGFANSFYANPKPEEPSGDLSDNWLEGSIKPALGAQYTMSSGAQIYAKLSAVGERTYGAAPSVVGEDASSFGVEDLSIGWRSGTSLNGLGENALDFTVGRTQYRLGHGLLLWDGASEGGTRGGYWTNGRKAFEFAAIGRFKPGHHTIEAFYLDKDDLPEADSETELWGVNYEYAFGEDTTLGASYLKVSADPNERPERDGLAVYNLRAFTAPFPNLKGLSFEVEYAEEDNGEALDSTAYNFLVAYQLDMAWQPKFSYRYAFFEGDDPGTAANEAFDGLLTGFYDWGTWWQGEIAGEYFLSNSNLISHQLRVHAKPNDAIGTGLILFDFLLDNTQSAGVTSDDIALELDWYMDWSLNDNFIVSFVAAVAEPGDAVEQSSGRTDTFWYGMMFVAYSF